MKKLLEHIEKCSKRLTEEYKEASEKGGNTSQEVADFREGWFASILGKYFPKTSRMRKSKIFDSYGNESCSIDTVVLAENHPHLCDFQDDKYSFILADGVDFVIELKSQMTKSELLRSFEQLDSVKSLKCIKRASLPPQMVKRHNTLNEHYVNKIPSFVYFFEMKGHMAISTFKKHLEDYCKNRDKNTWLDGIVLHEEWVVVKELDDTTGDVFYSLSKFDKSTFLAFLFILNEKIVNAELKMSGSILTHYIKSALKPVSYEILFRASEISPCENNEMLVDS
jgi:hypothetical protein